LEGYVSNLKITVVGLGYVGLVTAVCLSEKGHHLTCIDINSRIINLLINRRVPIYEPGLEKLIEKNYTNLSFTTKYEEAIINSRVMSTTV